MATNYPAIEAHLKQMAASQREATLTFEQTSGLMGHALPPSAFQNFAWWAAHDENSSPTHNAWGRIGWRVEAVDFDDQWVRFARLP